MKFQTETQNKKKTKKTPRKTGATNFGSQVTILPNTLALQAFGRLRHGSAVLFPILPLTAVGSSIGPGQGTFTMLAAIHKVADISRVQKVVFFVGDC